MADSGAGNASHGLIPTDAGAQAVNFQAREGLYRHPDVAPLGLGLPRLAPLHAAALLQSPVTALYAPGLVLQRLLLLRRHAQIIGGTMLHVSVWRDRPEHLDPSVTLQMRLPALRGISTASTRTLPPPSGFTRRLQRNRVSQTQPHSRIGCLGSLSPLTEPETGSSVRCPSDLAPQVF